MKISKLNIVLLCFAVLLAGAEMVHARGFGGGGGVGGRGGGGGGRSFGGGGGSRGGMSRPAPSRAPSRPAQRPASRPSSPSISRPSSRPSPSRPSTRPSPSRPSTRPSTRPSFPSTRPSTRPGSGGQRPGLQPGQRPSIQPGTRPGTGSGGRPSTRPSTRPGIDTGRPSFGGGNKPATRPSLPGSAGSGRPSQLPSRPGAGNRPGAGGRPSTLPGLGGGGTRPGIGDRPGAGNRPQRPIQRPSLNDRKGNLDVRMNNRNNIDISINNRQNNWNSRHNNFNNWHGNHYGHHGGWHHGNWHGGYHGGGRWNYWWNRYPVMTAFGVTTWAINRVGWAFGYNDYSNPYYVDNSTTVYDYSQPIVMTPDETTLAADPASTEPPPGVSEEGLSNFDQARVDFMAGDYAAAQKSTDAALKEIPNDTVIHEFRALVTFAQGNYNDSAATLYAVLSVGPGWDWTTLSGLYPSVDIYTKQLRALEEHCKKDSSDMAARFVLAYHYVTAGHEDAAKTQLELLVSANPKDSVSTEMLLRIDPEAKVPDAPKVEPPKPTESVAKEQFQGDWKATRGNNKFEMNLAENGEFSWKFAAGSDKPQEVRGIWSVDKDGVLAMEMSDEGVMLAQTIVKGNELDFYMLGDSKGTPPLEFKK